MRDVTSLFLLIASVLLTGSSLSAQTQFGTMTVDPETEQMWSDAVSRRVSISPLNTSISRNSKKVSLEFHNPTDDTLEMEIKVSNTAPEATKTIGSASKKAGKSLVSEKDTAATSIYKPLDNWIIKYPKKLILAPGEKKTIDIDVSIPESVGDGEYASWIVAEVAPRKALLIKVKEKMKSGKSSVNIEDISITISSSKIVYGGSNNKNNESRSGQ